MRVHFLILSALAVSGCDRLPKDVMEAIQVRSFYEVTSEVDPITDVTTLEAKATLTSSDGLNTSTISWSCRQPETTKTAPALSLSITSFKPPSSTGEMDGAPIETEAHDIGYFATLPTKVVQLRIGSNKPYAARCAQVDDKILSGLLGIRACDYINHVSVDLFKEDIGLPRSGEHYVGGQNHEIAYQYVVSGITYTYKAPINEDVARVLNACPKPLPKTPAPQRQDKKHTPPPKPTAPAIQHDQGNTVSSEPLEDDTTTPPPLYSSPQWTVPTGAQMADLFPARALDDEVGGVVEIECALNTEGRLTQCDIIHESPRGYGFGEATVRGFMRYARARPSEEGTKIKEGTRRSFRFTWAL